jgi:hypothetical protein
VEGRTFENVGIRYKGNGTISDAARSIKKSFKVDLDHFGGTDRFRGMKTINLHCGVADPSKCRETFGYALYRAAGVPAPRTALAEVWLTVADKHDHDRLGLYTLVEQVDKQFLREFFGSDKGLLMKPEGLRDFSYHGDDWNGYKKQFAAKREPTEEEAARVIAFARLVSTAEDDEFRREIASFLDIDGYLRFLATTAFVSNSDSFFGLGHNYYLYLHPDTHQFHFMPWDLDRAFANLPIFGTNNQMMNLSFARPYSGGHRLTERLLAMPDMREKYQTLLQDLATTCFAKDRLLREIESYENNIRDVVARDADAARSRKDASGGMFGRPPSLKTFVERRTASLAAQIAGTSTGHVPTGGFGPGGFKAGIFLASPMLEDLDTDKDEKLSKAEWLAGANKLFAACKKDDAERVNIKAVADGLNRLFPKPPDGGPGGFTAGSFMAAPIVRRADTDKDGKATLAELLAAAERLFDNFDKEQGGRLDEDHFSELLNDLLPPPNFFGRPERRPNDSEPGDKRQDEKS